MVYGTFLNFRIIWNFNFDVIWNYFITLALLVTKYVSFAVINFSSLRSWSNGYALDQLQLFWGGTRVLPPPIVLSIFKTHLKIYEKGNVSTPNIFYILLVILKFRSSFRLSWMDPFRQCKKYIQRSISW